jgi:hypothetical protein
VNSPQAEPKTFCHCVFSLAAECIFFVAGE